MATLKELAPQFLYTERLTMELFDHSDAHYECLLGATNSKTAHERMGDVGIRTPAEFDDFNSRYRLRGSQWKDEVADDDCIYLLRVGSHSPNGELVGAVSMATRVIGDTVLPPDLGWALLEPHMGKGYATEAALRFLKSAKEDLGYSELTVLPSETNPQSNRVAYKLGFVDGGRIADADKPGQFHNLLILPEMEKFEVKGEWSSKYK